MSRPQTLWRPAPFPHLAGLVLLLAACGGAGDGPTEAPGIPPGATRLAVERPQWTSQIGGITEPTRVVIRDRNAWEAFWRSFSGAVLPAPDPPAVDFGGSMVVVAAMGQRSTAGYDIRVEGVYRDGGTLYVDVLEIEPGAGCILAQVITTPATAVVVPTHGGPVEFVERRDTAPCS